MRRVYICIGPPGCGKRRWAIEKKKRSNSSTIIIDRSQLAIMLSGNEYDDDKLITDSMLAIFCLALRTGERVIVIDDTLVSVKARNPFMSLVYGQNRTVHYSEQHIVICVKFDFSFEDCFAEKSGDDPIAFHAANIQRLIEMYNKPMKKEGFDKIIIP